VGIRNPLVRLEWFGWRRRPARHVLLGLLFVACVGVVFLARYGIPKGTGGYSTILYRAIRGTPTLGANRPISGTRLFWATLVITFESGLIRLTTLLPWILVIRSVQRIRRLGLWDSLRLTSLTSRDWVAGLTAPPILLGAVALGLFLAGIILPDYLGRYGEMPEDLRTSYRLALVARIPFIGFEGAANGLLIAAITLHESLRSRRLFTVAGRSLGWMVVVELIHAFLVYALGSIALRFEAGGSYPRQLLISHGFQLSALAAGKVVLGLWILVRITRTLPARLQREAEEMGQ